MSQTINKRRIDEILIDLEYVTEEQVLEALECQRQHGGRIGSHLIGLGHLSEAQLLDGLSRQFRCESVILSRLEIPPEVIEMIPREIATARRVVPFEYDRGSNTVLVACDDPNDDSLMDELIFVFHDKNIRLLVAVDRALHDALERYYPMPSDPKAEFSETTVGGSKEDWDELPPDDIGPVGTVLVVTDDPEGDEAMGTALAQEGYDVVWTDSADDAISRIGTEIYRAVFVRDTVPGDYIDLIDRLRKVSPSTIVRYYESAGRMLIEEGGYGSSGDLISKNLQLFTTLLSSRDQVSSNHAAIVGKYVEKLCMRIGLPAKDRMSIVCAAYLHDVSRYYYGDSKSAPDCRARVGMTAKLLDSLNYPPLVVGILKAMYVDLEDKFTRRLPIENLGGNILTIVDVFCEHASFEKRMSLDRFETVRNNLVALTGRLFLREVSDAFLALIENEILVEPRNKPTTFNQVLMYCEDSDYLIAMSGRLKEEGFRAVPLDKVRKFVEMYQRSQPDMIILLVEGRASKARKLVTGLSKKGVDFKKVPTFLVASGQATPELAAMIEMGLEDVIPIENALDLLIVKLQKLRAANNGEEDEETPAVDEATPSITAGNLEDISLVDLLQAMGPSCRTARIRVASDGGKLTLYLDRGRIVFAEADDKSGAEAIYEGVAWKTGKWSVQPLGEGELPEPNNDTANEALLMEGCRRLDEKSRSEA